MTESIKNFVLITSDVPENVENFWELSTNCADMFHYRNLYPRNLECNQDWCRENWGNSGSFMCQGQKYVEECVSHKAYIVLYYYTWENISTPFWKTMSEEFDLDVVNYFIESNLHNKPNFCGKEIYKNGDIVKSEIYKDPVAEKYQFKFYNLKCEYHANLYGTHKMIRHLRI